jgi:cytidylate kinase
MLHSELHFWQFMRKLIVAIDGPSGAGKGTVARAIAEQLGYRHIDSGAMYRAVAWKALRDHVPVDEDAAVAALAERSQITLERERVMIDDIDVTRAIRTPEIDRAAAAVARLPAVRLVLVARQRSLGAGGAIVMEGRDIGSVVFPRADVKIYLDAVAEERARRRLMDEERSSSPAGIAEVASALTARDELDRTRSVSPLMVARDAVRVDTTGKPVEQVVREVMEAVRERLSSERVV